MPVNQTFRSMSSTSSVRPAETVSARTQTDTTLKPRSRRAGAYVSRSRFAIRGEALSVKTDRVAIRSQAPAGRSSILNPPAASTTLALTKSAAPASHSARSEEHTSELQSHSDLVCRLLLENKNTRAAY